MKLIGFNTHLKVSIQTKKDVQFLKAKMFLGCTLFLYLLHSSSLKPPLRHCYVFVAMLSLAVGTTKITSLQAMDQNGTLEESAELLPWDFFGVFAVELFCFSPFRSDLHFEFGDV